MTIASRIASLAGAISVVTAALTAPALAVDPPLGAVRVAQGLTHPLYATHAPDDFGRLFIVQQDGRIRVLNLSNNTLVTTPFLDISTLIATNWLEYGLLGMAFHPDYANNGFVYINYTPTGLTNADTLVVRYRVRLDDPNRLDTATATPILRFGFGNRREHRAGCMQFGPDGHLYIATGDGGENDPDNAAASTTTLRGKILRIDVNGADGIPGTADDDGFPGDANKNYQIPAGNPFAGSATNAQEIWHWGLRNPWRFSFDRLTGDMYIGDVGQGQREEVDFAAAGVGGLFYGWRCREGLVATSLACGSTAPAINPIHDYNHTIGLSVTGGYVYRGCAMPELRGTYIFGEYQISKIFSFRYSVAGGLTNFVTRTPEIIAGGGAVSQVASFGEDALGELYYCNYNTGHVYKIIPRTLAGPDCNGNQVSDLCEIAVNAMLDGNDNGVLDSCECRADFNGDGLVFPDDLSEYITCFFLEVQTPGFCPRADFNGDSLVFPDDLSEFITTFFLVPC